MNTFFIRIKAVESMYLQDVYRNNEIIEVYPLDNKYFVDINSRYQFLDEWFDKGYIEELNNSFGGDVNDAL